MGFRPNRSFAFLLACQYHRKDTRATLCSGGWAGIELQDPGTAGAGRSLAHAPTPSSLAFFTVPLGGT